MDQQRKFFSKSSEMHSNSEDIDPLSLYVRFIPPDFSQDDLTQLMSNNGERELTSVRLIRKPGMECGYGFVRFVSPVDASQALKELDRQPPVNLSVIFARKQKQKHESENKASTSSENFQSFKGRGRGMPTPSGEHNNNVYSNKEFVGSGSKGRGQQFMLDGPMSRLKICTDGGGRKVTVDSPPQQSEIQCNGQFADDELATVPNPFYSCSMCPKEGINSCKFCKKPYCSKQCQSRDYASHNEICSRAAELAESLLCFYKNIPPQNLDSGLGESSSSDPEKVDPVAEIRPRVVHKSQVAKIERLILSVGEVEWVDVIYTESLSKFWIQLKKCYQDFLKMEEKLSSLQNDLKHFHNQFSIHPQFICCTSYNNKICRAKVLKINAQNEIFVHLLDYGKSMTIQKTALCNLPAEFRSLPAQAVPCRLVSDDNEIIQWSVEDMLSFEVHTNNKSYKAQVFSCTNDVYDVSLINVDGIPLCSILLEGKKVNSTSKSITSPKTVYASLPNTKSMTSPKTINTPLSSTKFVTSPKETTNMAVSTSTKCITPSAAETDGQPLSVWSKLKAGVKMVLVLGVVDENSGNIWCYLVNGEPDLREATEIEKLLLNYSGEDISVTAEEGDFAAGLSVQYKHYFRCKILKRMQKSFLVHYIDYGNEEEITQIFSLSEELLQKCCYLVKCDKPSDLSLTEFCDFLRDSVEITVVKVDKNAAQLSFHKGKKYSVNCYPCYSNSLPGNEESVVQDLKVPESNKLSLPPANISHSKPIKSFQHDEYKASVEKITSKCLSPSTNYSVRIGFYKTASELYIHLKEDEEELKKMISNLNSFCNSKKSSYVPKIGEIVSCKFTDNIWYRGRVLEKTNDNDYRVFFIDYGNEDIVSQNCIQLLSDKFFSPQFSICASLSGVKNAEITKILLSKLLTEEWDMKVINSNKTPYEIMLFQKNVPITEMITNKIKSNLKFQKLPDKSTVKICFEDEKYIYVNQVKDIKALEEMSVKLNSSSNLPTPKCPMANNVYSGLFVDGLFYRICIKEEVALNSFKVYFLDYGNFETVKACDLRELPDELFTLPVYCTAVQVQDRKELPLRMDVEYTVEVIGMQRNVQVVKFLDLDKSSNSITKDEVNVNEAKTNAKDKSSLIYKKLPENEIINVKVSFIDDKFVYLHHVNDLQSITDLLVELNSLSELPPVVKPVVNNVYCGLCSDGCWYRVYVEEVTSSDTYKVYFLDFGNYESLSIEKLRELPINYFSVPVFCIPVINEKKDLKLDEQFKIRVIGKKENVQKVEIVDCQKDNSSVAVNGNRDDVEKAKTKPAETEKLPHISSLKKQKLTDGLTKVKFCDAEGDIFYCQLLSDDENIQNMFKPLQKCGREGKVPSSVSVGDVICAQSSDGHWYRAFILCDKKSPSYKVKFLDYGNSEFVTGDCIKILPTELLNFPVFAIPMKIVNADKIADISICIDSMLVKKVKEIDDGTYAVELQLEENINQPKISTLQTLTLPRDVISKVTVCHADGSLFYVQPISNIENLTKLSSQLSEADSFSKIPQAPEEDDIICAKYIDDIWYRCAVKQVQSDKIKVCFIDYGNTDLVSTDNIRIIPHELCTYPIASIPIKFKDEKSIQSKLRNDITTIDVEVCNVIDNVQIVDIVSHSNQPVVQSSYIPTFLSSFTKSNLSLEQSCKVIFKKNMNDLHIAVKLDDSDEMEKLHLLLQESETDVIKHLPSVDEVLLAKKDNFWYRCSVVSSLPEENVCKVYFFDIGVIEDVQKSEMRNLPDTCKTYPIFAIKTSVESDQPVLLDNCYNIFVLNKKSDDIYTVKVYHQYKYSAINHRELVPMKASEVAFFHREGEKLFLQNISDLEILAKITQILASHCSSNSCIPYKPDVGELVCAMSQMDNSWYRACIEEVLPCDEYKVFFIDFGNCENVQRKHLQPMPFSLTQFPSLVIPVKFVNNEVIELEKMYKVIADSKVANGVQIVRMADSKQVFDTTEHHSISNTAAECDITFSFDKLCHKIIPFESGEQDIVIYNVDKDYGSLSCAPFNIDNIQANLLFPDEITEHCNSKGIPFDDSQPQLGEMVLALFAEDRRWYRAAVIKKSHPDYDVNFVDFGNCETVNITSLRKMEEKFMEFKIQSHLCSLAGVTFPPENKTKVISELKKFTFFNSPESLRAYVKIVNEEYTVNIPAITSHLVKQNLATAVDEK